MRDRLGGLADLLDVGGPVTGGSAHAESPGECRPPRVLHRRADVHLVHRAQRVDVDLMASLQSVHQHRMFGDSSVALAM